MALKTVAVEITRWEAVALISDAQTNLGRLYAEHNERENFQFLIEGARADLAKWQAVLDTLDKPVLWRNIK
jgi:hypothetical protein